jgi:hypothetical protein
MRFEVDAVDKAGRILGRNVDSKDIPIGSTFAETNKVRCDSYSFHRASPDLGVIANIKLILKKVEFYRRSIDVIPGGHSAAIVVEGNGMSALNAVLKERKKREYIYTVVQPQY